MAVGKCHVFVVFEPLGDSVNPWSGCEHAEFIFKQSIEPLLGLNAVNDNSLSTSLTFASFHIQLRGLIQRQPQVGRKPEGTPQKPHVKLL